MRDNDVIVPWVVAGERENNMIVPWDTMRHPAQENSSLILVAKRTPKIELLNSFKLYTDCHNISNDHY